MNLVWKETFNSDLRHASESADRLRQDLDCKSYDVLDFFSGCGGLSYGFHVMGEHTGIFKISQAFELDLYANMSYARNLGLVPSRIDLANSTVKDLAAIYGKVREGRLIVMGGPPCQGFSSHKKRFPGLDSRNMLVEKFGAIAVGLGADVVIMENVPDLIAKKHWHHYSHFQSLLKESGYHIAAGIVNTAEYGVPQERFRFIVIAAKHFVPTLPLPRFSRGNFRTVRQAIGWLPPLTAGEASRVDPMHVTSKHRKETVQIIRKVPKDGGSRPPGVGPKCLDRVAGFYDVYGRLSWDKPAITITARCRTPSCGRYSHPQQNRGLTVREAALLQGFPPEYFLEGPFDDKFKQIGNAVPPIFSLHLATHVLSMIAGHNRGSADMTIDAPTFESFSIVIAHLKNNKHRQTS
jgi:DNA (cytosine-5)-methyltransferase 1